MPEYLSQVVAHSLVASLVAEALLRVWKVTSPQHRLTCRLGALALPLLLLPIFALLAPFRHTEAFADGPALFASQHLAAVKIWGIGVERLWPWPVVGLGVLLLSRDLWPLLTSRASHPLERLAVAPAPAPASFVARIDTLAALAGIAAPPVVVVRSETPVLLCMGAFRPRLLVSQALLELLDEAELEAALAHELSHLRHRDVLWSWVLLGLRLGQAVSPFAQVLGRVVTLETELRADAEAARWTGRPAALASALLKVFGGGYGAASGDLGLSLQLERAHTLALEERCRRLLAGPSPVAPPGPGLFAAAALGLIGVLFFVT